MPHALNFCSAIWEKKNVPFFFLNREVVCCHYGSAVCLHDSQARKKGSLTLAGAGSSGPADPVSPEWRGTIKRTRPCCFCLNIALKLRKEEEEGVRRLKCSDQEWKKCDTPPTTAASPRLLREAWTWSSPPSWPQHVSHTASSWQRWLVVVSASSWCLIFWSSLSQDVHAVFGLSSCQSPNTSQTTYDFGFISTIWIY